MPLAGFLLTISACSFPPERVAWNETEKVIQPQGEQGKGPGSLLVETVRFGTEHGEDRRRPFFVYDETGRYLTHFPNDSMSPVPLPAGRYVVVTSIRNTNRRVQVLIKEGCTTTIGLSDFIAGPEAHRKSSAPSSFALKP
jgi:hypothetical protein